MGRFMLDPAFPAELGAAVLAYLDEDLGPRVAEDAKAACPVDTGRLRDSIDHHMEGLTLIVDAGPWDVPRGPYAAYVALGHVNYRDNRGRFRAYGDPRIVSGPEYFPPQPFLQAALYTAR